MVSQVNFTGNLIPSDFGTRLQTRARKSTLLKLENFIELRDFYVENEERIKSEGMDKFYAEAADWMDYSPNTVDKNLDIIRNYTEEKLVYWVTNGLSFDHIETANWLQNESPFYGEQLLDAAIQLGSANGKRMTTAEMTAFALGTSIPKPKTFSIVNTLSKWLSEIPSKFPDWSPSKVEEALGLIKRLMELMK